MTAEIIIQIILLGIALSMDAFAVSITYGIAYNDLNKKRIVLIALTFGIMQALMPLIGYFLVELIGFIVDENAGDSAGNIMSIVVSWIAFALLIFIGSKMIYEAIRGLRSQNVELKHDRTFNIKELIYFGFATAIDALGTGVAMHAGLSDNVTIFIHVAIIMSITFVISLIGLILGKQFVKLFKGKNEIASIIGGVILIGLAVWIIISNNLS